VLEEREDHQILTLREKFLIVDDYDKKKWSIFMSMGSISSMEFSLVFFFLLLSPRS
jgi:hypothetical protein